MAKMLRADLAGAREQWVDAAGDDPDETRDRMASDFLKPVNDRGEMVDFHALRHSAATLAAQSGASVRAIMALMRPSSAELSIARYGHLIETEAADTVNRIAAGTTNAPTNGGADLRLAEAR